MNKVGKLILDLINGHLTFDKNLCFCNMTPLGECKVKWTKNKF